MLPSGWQVWAGCAAGAAPSLHGEGLPAGGAHGRRAGKLL